MGYTLYKVKDRLELRGFRASSLVVAIWRVKGCLTVSARATVGFQSVRDPLEVLHTVPSYLRLSSKSS